MQLRIPGPTPVPAEVLEATGREMINHRGPEFAALVRRVTDRLKAWYQTEHDVLILTASGTGGMEAAVVNTLSPGDRVLVVSIGAFGDRFADIARAFGADVLKLDFPWGAAADPDAVRRQLRAEPGVRAVVVTHNETSTGVTNDLPAIARAIHEESGALLVVDAVSSLAAIDLPTDALGCDVVVTASQKAWMVPPGLAMVSYGPRAWEAYSQSKMPRFYWDLGKARKSLESGQTPATPAVSLFYALDVALAQLDVEGREVVYARHARVGTRAREGVRALGLELLVADERYASNTVTAVKVPGWVDVSKLLRLLRQEHGVVLSGGQGKLSGQIFRIGHMGFVDVADMDEVVAAIGAALPVARQG